MDEQSKSAPPTLTDDDIVEVERPNRRSALAAIGASVAAVQADPLAIPKPYRSSSCTRASPST